MFKLVFNVFKLQQNSSIKNTLNNIKISMTIFLRFKIMFIAKFTITRFNILSENAQKILNQFETNRKTTYST